MGLADWWTQHRNGAGLASPTRASELARANKATASDAAIDVARVPSTSSSGASAGGKKPMKRSKSERLTAAHGPCKSPHPALRVHGSAHVTTKGLFQQAFAAKFFPRLKHLRRAESPTPAADAAESSESPLVAADESERRRAGGSRLRALFSRSTEPTATGTSAASASASSLATDAARELEEQVVAALASGVAQLQLTSEGCGGAYFVQPEGSGGRSKRAAPLGVFKPRDEEYMAPQNPRGYVKEGAVVGETEHPVNRGFRVGCGALRERAAYALDAAYGGFSGVPATTLATLEVRGARKEGSLQRFAPSASSAEDMGPRRFAIPEVHKVGILDVRLFNTDRHAGNVLLAPRADEQTFAMTPIDHGFCLPACDQLDGATLDWLLWPQAQFPFTGAELDHIAALEPARDAALLRALGIDEPSVATMRMSTAFLLLGADAGFSLFEIGSCLAREGDLSAPSAFEQLVAAAARAVEQAQPALAQARDVAYYDALVAEVERGAAALFAELPKKKVRSISCFS